MNKSIVLALVAVANAVDSNSFKYMQYISKFNKSPATIEDFNMRLSHFLETDKFIEEWNADLSNTHRVGHNVISDWTPEERAKLTQLGKGKTFKNPNADVPKHQVDLNQVIPNYWNWTA
jgi:hypothetical protein